MGNKLEQLAIKSFTAVPELYQQFFKKRGVDFPDQLVSEIKKDPSGAVNLLNSNEQLKTAVIALFEENQDEVMKAMQPAFKFGGKFQAGGKVVNDRRDNVMGTATHWTDEQGNRNTVLSREYITPGVYDYTWRKITPSNDTTYRKFLRTGENAYEYQRGNKYVTPTAYGKLNFLQKLKVGEAPTDWEKAFSVNELQDGGELTRREALEKAAAEKGYNREQAITAYRNAKIGLRRQGLRGKELRQTARQQISRNVVDRTNLPNLPALNAPKQEVTAPQERISARPVADYNNLDFGNRFKLARQAGESNFTWRGKTYTTEVSKPNPISRSAATLPTTKPVETLSPSAENIPFEENNMLSRWAKNYSYTPSNIQVPNSSVSNQRQSKGSWFRRIFDNTYGLEPSEWQINGLTATQNRSLRRTGRYRNDSSNMPVSNLLSGALISEEKGGKIVKGQNGLKSYNITLNPINGNKTMAAVPIFDERENMVSNIQLQSNSSPQDIQLYYNS